MTEWISPVDRHRHYGEAGRASCAVCRLEAERDRLRAVVGAARAVLAVIDSTPVGQMIDGIEGHDEITLLREQLAQLDGSTDMGGG